MNKPETNLWLDDVRPCPFVGNWQVAKNYTEAVEILTKYRVVKCSLDHDLSPEHYFPSTQHSENLNFKEKTGYDLVCWIQENAAWPVEPPIVHSFNPVGARRMALVLARHYDCRSEDLLQPYKKPQ
jgi:hypothetical protein